MRFSLAALSVTCALSACTSFPELDAALSPATRAAAYPELVPLETLMATLPQSGTDAALLERQIEARVARLRARAARLRGPVIDRRSRARLAERPA